MILPTFNVPPIGPRQGKLWGWTQLLYAHNSVEVHRLSAKPGGYSSRHMHRFKWNRFVLLSGKLAVRIYRGEDVDETVLLPGQVTDVPPGVCHEFEALEESEALEIYWVVLDAGDIERENTGGVHEA